MTLIWQLVRRRRWRRMRRDEAAEISPSEIMAAVPSACMLHAADPDLRLAVPNACSMPLMDNMFHRHVFGEQGEGVTATRLSSPTAFPGPVKFSQSH